MATVNEVGNAVLAGDSPVAGRYRRLRRLGTGASSEVFVVEDKATKDRAVLKLVTARASSARLRLEFLRLTELEHPNIVRVRDAGLLADVSPARAFMVMDYVAGPSLVESLAGLADEARAQAFTAAARALADALAYLHARGVLHGDISPANVRCDDGGRPVLLDFGLSPEGAAVSGPVAGTLGFMAPEVLLGERGALADLFALGATLYQAWTGSAPFGVGLDAAKRVWQAPPPAPSSLRAGLTPDWDRLILRLLAANRDDRPTSARELLREIARMGGEGKAPIDVDLAAPFPAGDPLVGVVVGRADEEAVLREHLDRLAEGVASVSVLWLAGPVGSGRRTLLQRGLRDARLAMLVESIPDFEIEVSECAKLRRAALAPSVSDTRLPEAEPVGRAQAEIAALVAELEERAVPRPLCLALAGSTEDHALAEAVMSSPPSGRLLLLVPCEQARQRAGCSVLSLTPLSRQDIAELALRGAGVEAPAAVVDGIASATRGLAGAVAILVRSWIRNVREGKPTLLDGPEGAPDLATLLDRGFASLDSATRAFLVAAVLDGPGQGSEESEARARAAGWLAPEGNALPSPLHVEALWRAVAADPFLQEVAGRESEALPAGDLRWAELQAARGESEKAAQGFWDGMRSAHASHAVARVAELGLRASKLSPKSGSCADRLVLAGALGVCGRYKEGLAVLDAGRDGYDAIAGARVAERQAWLLGRQGKNAEAMAIIDKAMAGLGAGSDEAQLLRGRMARVLVSTGQFAAAFRAAEPSLLAEGPAALPAREAAVLALAYGGRLAEARRLVDDLVPRMQGTPGAARLASLDGLVHQLSGQPALAATAYRLAIEGYRETRDGHGGAAATFNLGCTLAELGDYGAALAALEAAVRDLGRLGAAADQALALFNLGQLFLQLGDLEAAGRAQKRLAEDASASAVEAFRGYACLLDAELARRRQSLPAARESYGQAHEILSRVGMPTVAAIAELGRAEVLAEMGDAAGAAEIVSAVAGDCRAGELEGNLREATLLARGRLALVAADGTTQALALAETLSHACDEAKQAGRLPMAWRLASLGSRLFGRAQDVRQAGEEERARKLFSEVMMKTPAKHWSAMRGDPDARIIEVREEHGQSSAELATRMALLEGRLRRLLRINKRLNSDLRLSRVLETIIDTVIELTDAERGFLLLKDGAGDLVVKVARNIDQTSLEGPALSLSRSIAKQAADSGQPVVAVDAAGDSRFSELLSVSDLHLRSVLAVPLSVKGRVVGTLYVDHRLRKGVFGDDELALVLDFAEQGAIAIENARVLSELRRREQQVQSLNRRLEHDLRLKQAALEDVRIELKESRQAAALRYDYREIVGQSPGMLEVFRLLDRVTDTNLPVVIEGESGTGKELVARAIHFHGPRKDHAFVSENCAAIPETLLESTLFGHVRGAFTGADRDARGLFAVASGGTLFLDEVAEMSPAMQGKLLRVLQEGEFHRVGSEKVERADVRVVVATNKHLPQLVEEGKFRKDLFYRLSVVQIRLPPLRERREDIPLLLRHFLDKAASSAAGRRKTIEPAAVEKLCNYPWPGNVRELENEIARAGVFAGATIGIADLSPHIQSGQDAIESIRGDSDSLGLKNRVERLERQLIREAMNRSQGNQTKAASLLGLSRFGLQKKLRRYNLTPR